MLSGGIEIKILFLGVKPYQYIYSSFLQELILEVGGADKIKSIALN